jgi:hypothetical protein
MGRGGVGAAAQAQRRGRAAGSSGGGWRGGCAAAAASAVRLVRACAPPRPPADTLTHALPPPFPHLCSPPGRDQRRQQVGRQEGRRLGQPVSARPLLSRGGRAASGRPDRPACARARPRSTQYVCVCVCVPPPVSAAYLTAYPAPRRPPAGAPAAHVLRPHRAGRRLVDAPPPRPSRGLARGGRRRPQDPAARGGRICKRQTLQLTFLDHTGAQGTAPRGLHSRGAQVVE